MLSVKFLCSGLRAMKVAVGPRCGAACRTDRPQRCERATPSPIFIRMKQD